MKIRVNGQEIEVAARTVRELVESLGLDSERLRAAVAVNEAVVPRSRWAETMLCEGDTVEIIRAVQGG